MWKTWGNWNNCAYPCGGGTQTRSRYKKQEKAFGGEECYGTTTDTRQCNDDCRGILIIMLVVTPGVLLIGYNMVIIT